MEEAPTMRVTDQLKLRSFQSRITTIAVSEHQYVEVFETFLVQYMKAMKGNLFNFQSQFYLLMTSI